MKYYIYISDAKVNMLFDNIPQDFLGSLSGELKINLGLISTTFKEKSSNTIISKLHVVENYIEKHMSPGTVDKPNSYFKGKLPMRWGPLREHPGVTYFGGSTEKTELGMIGSECHTIQGGKSEAETYISNYALFNSVLQKELGSELEQGFLDLPDSTSKLGMASFLDEEEYARIKSRQTKSGRVDRLPPQPQPKMTLEFMAKKLISEYSSGKEKLLGTPLYVALE